MITTEALQLTLIRKARQKENAATSLIGAVFSYVSKQFAIKVILV